MLGELRIVARADLGGLGAAEGPPTLCIWTPANVFPQLLPWIGILVLLLLPANRCASAWWVWAPLLALAAVEWVASGLIDALPSEALDMFALAFGSLGFGVAGVWLAAPYLGQKSRWIAFFTMLLTLGLVGGLACVIRGGTDVGYPQTLAILIFVGASSLLLASSLSLAGLLSRRRPGAGRLLLWLAVLLAVSWTVLSLPFLAFALMVGDGPEWYEMMTAVLSFAGLTFATALPFLLLAFLAPFYRERLWRFLRLDQPGAPPPSAPPIIQAETGG